MGRAEDLRDELRARGEAAIDRMIWERETEGAWLDFKNRGGPSDAEDNLGKAVSAFANTDGGVLTWGIDARATRSDPADVAPHVRPVAVVLAGTRNAPNQFTMRLNISIVNAGAVPARELYLRAFPPDIQQRAYRKLAMVATAARLDDLRALPGSRLEALRGDRAGQHSVRINDQRRVCFVWRDGGAEQVEIVDYH